MQSAETKTAPPTLQTFLEQVQSQPWETSFTILGDHLNSHLAEMRYRLWVWLASFLLSLIIGWWKAPWVLKKLEALAPIGTLFVQLSPGEAMGVTMEVALWLGLLLSSPIGLYQFGCFVLPGLTPTERRWLAVLAVFGIILFTLGLAFAYWALLPVTLQVLLSFGSNVAQLQLQLKPYVGFVMLGLFLGGLIAELPLLILSFGLLGWVKSSQLLLIWREVVVAGALIAALITPTQDPLTMGVVALMLGGLYTLSWFLLKLLGK